MLTTLPDVLPRKERSPYPEATLAPWATFTGVGSAPSISVVVPVRDRRSLLRRTLDALDAQTLRDFEVVVVDDGSVDGSDDEAVRGGVAGHPVRLVRSHGAGAVAARCLGVEASRGEVLAFTDSDCEPAPIWLDRVQQGIASGAVLVSGRTVMARPRGMFERSMSDSGSGLFPTCNLAVTRRAYDSVGGFDPQAGSHYGFRSTRLARGTGFGEDTIFAWSIARRQPWAYDEDMVVTHHVFAADRREWLDRSWQTGAFTALVRDVPELRHTLVRHKVLFGRRSRVSVYATALALLTRRPSLVALAAGWWVVHRWRWTVNGSGLPLPAKLRALPLQLLLDVVQAAALLTGSVRHRTLLL